jgi:hypothetical protein
MEVEDHDTSLGRWLILLGGGLTATFGSRLLKCSGAGGLAAILLAFTAGARWRREGGGDNGSIIKLFRRMWIVLEPTIFALIGTAVQVDKIDLTVLWHCMLVLCGGLAARLAATFLALSCSGLNTKEKVFLAVAWLPLGPILAAIGPAFLDGVQGLPAAHWRELAGRCLGAACPSHTALREQWAGWGEDLLTLAVLAILVTGPAGALAMMTLGPRLLAR